MHLHLEDYDNAIADYDEAIRLDPGYTAAYTGRAMAYEQKGDSEKARSDYAKALSLPPKYGSGKWAQNTARDSLARLERKDVLSNDSEAKEVVVEKPTFAPVAPDSRRVALVIGNSAYQHVAQLGNPESDARAVALALRRLGFSSVTLSRFIVTQKVIFSHREVQVCGQIDSGGPECPFSLNSPPVCLTIRRRSDRINFFVARFTGTNRHFWAPFESQDWHRRAQHCHFW